MLFLYETAQIQSTSAVVHSFNAKVSAQHYNRRHNSSQAAHHAGGIYRALQDMLHGSLHGPVQLISDASSSCEAAAQIAKSFTAMHDLVPQPYNIDTLMHSPPTPTAIYLRKHTCGS